MNVFVGLSVAVAVILFSFPLRQVVPEPWFIVSLAAVAGIASFAARWILVRLTKN